MQSKNAQTNPHHEIQQAIASYFQPSGNTSKQESKKTIQGYLAKTHTPNLLDLDYGPALRKVGIPIIEDLHAGILLKDTPHIHLFLTLLAGIKQSAHVRAFVAGPHENHLQRLDNMIDQGVKSANGRLEDISWISNLNTLNTLHGSAQVVEKYATATNTILAKR